MSTKIMQKIKQDIMDSQNCSGDQAVRYISKLVSRSTKVVYEWLSNNRPDIPRQTLEILKRHL